MIIVRWKVLSWKEKPQGELKIHQLRDNIRRHHFVERDGTIWIGIRAANRPVAFDEMMAADIVPELMYF
jgi:hypothetical protein